MYFFTKEAINNFTKIIKIKISKLNIKCLCNFDNGYFMGGYNRKIYPGGGFTNKRTIYYIEKLTEKKKNKPQYEINIPKNNYPVTVLQIQYPYLMCYC
jgi:hypothetical protein